MTNKYETHVLPKLLDIAEMVRKGLNEEQIAENIGVAYSTFREYKKKYSALSAALKKEKEARNECVEDSLYTRATGTFVTVKKPVKVKKTEYDPTTGKKVREWEEVVVAEEQQYIPPDTGANIFWLVNHCGDKYKNNPHRIELDKEKLELAKAKAEKEDW